jgi:SAM-dependent methyltransferase
MFTYDFGYSWWLVYGHLVPLVLFGGLAAVAVWRGWRRWIAVLTGAIALWALAAFVVMQVLNRPVTLPSEQFLAGGTGRVLDVGAGSGRLAIGVLQARPRATATALDIYSGYFGIEDNTPERLMANAEAGGVADRLDWKVGDMREMPFADAEFDAVVSAFAMDHVGEEGAVAAVREAARVVRPEGDFLLMIVNTDGWVRFVSLLPHHGLAHHPAANAARWRGLLEQAGFDVLEEGTQPATLYFLSRKSGPAGP